MSQDFQSEVSQIKRRLAVLRAVTVDAIARCLAYRSQAVVFAKEQAILDSQVQELRCALSKLELDSAKRQPAIRAV
jgi:hypothetical protein